MTRLSGHRRARSDHTTTTKIKKGEHDESVDSKQSINIITSIADADVDLAHALLHVGESIGLDTSSKKAASVQFLANGSAPKFSLLSGVQLWRNAVVIYLNIDGDTYQNDVVTEMAPDGSVAELFVSWFAQRRHHLASKEIVRLRAPDARILLMTRLVGGSYVCAGLCELDDFDEHASPLRFRFRLMHAQTLVSKAQQAINDDTSAAECIASLCFGDRSALVAQQ